MNHSANIHDTIYDNESKTFKILHNICIVMSETILLQILLRLFTMHYIKYITILNNNKKLDLVTFNHQRVCYCHGKVHLNLQCIYYWTIDCRF